MSKLLTHKQIKDMHEKAYLRGYDVRLRAAEDMAFAWVSQWDDAFLESVDLEYKGQFDILRKAMRQIISDLKLNPIQVDFEPEDETDDTASDILDGAYRADMRNNMALEASGNANQESIVCGIGGWELITEYKNDLEGDYKQVIRRKPIYEFNNNAMCDPDAKLLDKADAKYWSVLESYTPDGLKALKEELGDDGDDENYESDEDNNEGGYGSSSSFAFPEISYTFPWFSGNDLVYVTRFYHKTKEKVKFLRFTDEFGGVREMREYDITKEIEDELVDEGYELDSEKVISRNVVRLYIADGNSIIKSYVIAGEHLPIIPQYGERQYIEGVEWYEGIVRLAKDPVRLRNFQLSYLATIVSRSPREKPIFTSEQLAGFEDMYEPNGYKNNYPYLMQNGFFQGQPLPVGPIGYIKAPEIPAGLMPLIGESRQAVEDVASSGLPQDITDTQMSGKAIQAMQKRFDMQSYTYQDSHKFAMRREGEIYASMFIDIKDTEEEITLVKADGSKQKEVINRAELDFTTMESDIKNDVKKMRFSVYADIGQAFESVKAQNKEEIKELLNGMLSSGGAQTPEYKMLYMKYLGMIDGMNFKDVRDYARKELIMMGVQEPESDEEKQMVADAQQNQKPSAQDEAMMLEGQARMLEGQAAMQNEQNDAAKIQVDMFNAETNRSKLGLDADKFRLDKQGKSSVESVKLQQSQQKINIDYQKMINDMALRMADMEAKYNAQFNANVQQNIATVDNM